MFEEHPALEDPRNDSLKLWRYINLEKFVSMMNNSELYFCRADYFRKDDQFEGTFPKLEYNTSLQDIGKEETRILFETTSKNTFVSCWTLNENENFAMWKLSTNNIKDIAIQTDMGSFKHFFEKSGRPIIGGKIQYIDYEKDPYYGRSEHNYNLPNAFRAYVHKRINYDYEKEYRAICTDNSDEDIKGIKIKVTLDKLIHNIFLRPKTSIKNIELVKDCANSINKKIKVQESSFDSRPYY